MGDVLVGKFQPVAAGESMSLLLQVGLLGHGMPPKSGSVKG